MSDGGTNNFQPGIRTARSRSAWPVFVCGKCLKRMPDGKAFRRALKDAVRDRADVLGGRKARIVRTGCLGLCPKRAAALASAATLAAGTMLVVEEAAALPDAVARLLPG